MYLYVQCICMYDVFVCMMYLYVQCICICMYNVFVCMMYLYILLEYKYLNYTVYMYC